LLKINWWFRLKSWVGFWIGELIALVLIVVIFFGSVVAAVAIALWMLLAMALWMLLAFLFANPRGIAFMIIALAIAYWIITH